MPKCLCPIANNFKIKEQKKKDAPTTNVLLKFELQTEINRMHVQARPPFFRPPLLFDSSKLFCTREGGGRERGGREGGEGERDRNEIILYYTMIKI